MSAERPEAGGPAQPPPDGSVPPEPEVTAPADAEPTLPQHTVEPTRTSMVWTMVGIGVVLSFAILVFILQNGQRVRVRVRFLMANGTLPLGAAPSPRRPAALTSTGRHGPLSNPCLGTRLMLCLCWCSIGKRCGTRGNARQVTHSLMWNVGMAA
jgi:hypothetical protein